LRILADWDAKIATVRIVDRMVIGVKVDQEWARFTSGVKTPSVLMTVRHG
jgi:hypothetical protein